MRLAAQLQGGFYPAPPEAVAHAATFLCPPRHQAFAILDPCAGEGAAILQLAELLGCRPDDTYGIELDEGRAERLRATLPGAQVLAPANFFGCRASPGSFSFIWLNPPFDDSYGGHRVEERCLQTATDWLMPGGVMALVCPEDVVDDHSDMRRHFATSYENCQIVPFPETCRRFKEVIVFGQKRRRLVLADREARSWADVHAPHGFVYSMPPGTQPRQFLKVEPTELELRQMLAQSPLRAHLTAPPTSSLSSPPLALGVGHIALLLASGHLDGVVCPEDEPPHVVRGTSRKREYVADVTETVNDNGSTTTKTTLAQKIELAVRTIDGAGNLRTYASGGDDDDPP